MSAVSAVSAGTLERWSAGALERRALVRSRSRLNLSTLPDMQEPSLVAEPHFHLFTYGTLRADGAAAELMSRCERISEGAVHGTLYDTGSFPALLLSGSDRVEGEVWRCPADMLPHLDRYEAVRERLFRRVGVEVDGTPCWVYVAGPALGERLTPDARVRPEARWR